MKSVFLSNAGQPTAEDLGRALKSTGKLWQEIESFTIEKFPAAKAEWKFSGEKFGWSYRISDRKRVIVYLLPRDGFFKVAFVFGKNASDSVFESDIAPEIKTALRDAKSNAEGRGIRIDVNDRAVLADIQKLIRIKIAH